MTQYCFLLLSSVFQLQDTHSALINKIFKFIRAIDPVDHELDYGLT